MVVQTICKEGESQNLSIALLGKTIDEVERKLGYPLVSYTYRGALVYLYDTPELITVEFKNRIVTKFDQCAERRSHPRVHPPEKTFVQIEGKEHVVGYLQDISVASIAVNHAKPITLLKGDPVVLTISLPFNGNNIVIKLTAVTFATRRSNNKFKTVFIFTDSEETAERKLVSQYIQTRLVDIAMSVYFKNAEG